MYLQNTLIADSPSGGDCFNDGGVINHTNSLIEDNSCGPILSGDPLLGPLADNGSPTQTHALLNGSPALDAGDSATCLPIDQRGVTRPQGNDCDIGAYESQGFYLSIASGNNQTTGINTAFAAPLQVSLIASDTTVNVGAGHVITYTAPLSGASLSPAVGVFTATTESNGTAGLSATANGLEGKYVVTATTENAWNKVTFSLTNTVHYSLTVNVLGSGTVTPTSGVFPTGTLISLTARPDTSWSLVNWSGSLSGTTNPINLLMDRDKIVTATFALTASGIKVYLPLVLK
jgi:hypothetical protein